jgi:8-amino-7-oxononanoate synthase
MPIAMNREAWIQSELESLRRDGLLRSLRAMEGTGGHVVLGGRKILNFASNDYLDLANHPRVVAAGKEALETFGAGATASRLVAGTLELHGRLEARIAAHKGYPAALVTGSGYIANVGAIPALVGRGDAVFADKLAHASIIDGAMQSRAELFRFRHNDAGHLRALLAKHGGTGRKLVVTESVFSMDGDIAPLTAIAESATAAGAMLMVDEAHSAGVFGAGGCGLVRGLGLCGAVNLSMSTLSKAFGGYGGVLACSEAMREWFISRNRGFIYSTALPPAVLGSALGALDVLEAEPERGARLLRNAAVFRERLKAAGLDTCASESQIIPVMVGDNHKALALSQRLLAEHGILAVAIRPPTVPKGTARLRLSVTLAHTPEELESAAAAIVRTFATEGTERTEGMK